MKILLIEDDVNIGKLIKAYFSRGNYELEISTNGKDGLKAALKNSYDVILLDLMLPGLPGEEVCKRIREKSEIPIIVTSAKEKVVNRVDLLKNGADDYLVKPFDLEELELRITIVTKNKIVYKKNNVLSFKNIKINLDTKEVFLSNKLISLTKTEFLLLELLIKNKNIVVNREKIITDIWGYDYEGDGKIVDVNINNLRKKMDPKKEHITSIRGVGYIVK